MILPQSRYQTRYRPEKSRKSGRIVLALVLLAVFSIIGIVLYVTLVNRNGIPDNDVSETDVQTPAYEESLNPGEMWERHEYSTLIDWAKGELQKSPMAMEALVYHGFASFYHGVGQFTQEEQIPYFDEAIRSLRRVLLYEKLPLEAEVNYVLGKAYYHKGRYYSDLALEYLKRSMTLGFEGADTLEYLGLANGELGRYEKSLGYFLAAAEKRPGDILFLTIGQTYDRMEEDVEAVKYLERAIESTEDETIEKKSRFILGKIYLRQDKWGLAEDQYRIILQLDKRSADAYYYLGEIYEKQNNFVKARAEWRRALEIDPSHYGALTKLY
jgi:tetratricopeptide (TPR) repeat protein